MNQTPQQAAEEKYPLDYNNMPFTGSQENRREAFVSGAEWKEQQGWVSVKDGLPEIPPKYYDNEDECWTTPLTINVIVYDKIEDAVFQESFGIIPWDKDITHWRYLPEKPINQGESKI